MRAKHADSRGGLSSGVDQHVGKKDDQIIELVIGIVTGKEYCFREQAISQEDREGGQLGKVSRGVRDGVSSYILKDMVTTRPSV